MTRWLRLIPLLALAGCAKLPDTATGGASTRLAFTITLAREVNPNYVYMVALRPSTDDNPTEQGPIPVIAPPWGNGFVAGTVTHFVSWANVQSPRYLLYRFRDALLIDYFALGAPVNYVDVLPGGKELRFEIDLTQIAPDAATAALYRSLQFNILTNDRIPQGAAGSKVWDALGDGRLASEINTPITISLRNSRTFDNAGFLNLEPNGDVADPDLDIVDWKVEVRRQ